jgi:hypothetical protein
VKIVASSYFFTMLKDPIYAGFFYQQNERYEVHDSIPRIITEEQHHKILRMLGDASVRKTGAFEAVYAGFIKSPFQETVGPDFKSQVICDCKKKFSYTTQKTCPVCKTDIAMMQNPKYLEFKYYYNTHRKKRREQYKSIEEKAIDQYLVKYFDENLTLSKPLVEWSLKYLHEIKDKEISENQLILKSNSNYSESLEKRKSKARDLLISEVFTKEDYQEELQAIKITEKRIIKNQTKIVDWLSHAKDLLETSSSFPAEIIQNGTKEQKRELLGRLGSNLTWDEKKVSIINSKSVQTLINGLISAKRKNPQFEPRNTFDISGRNEDFASVSTTLLPRQGSNPSRAHEVRQ